MEWSRTWPSLPAEQNFSSSTARIIIPIIPSPVSAILLLVVPALLAPSILILLPVPHVLLLGVRSALIAAQRA
jgi:hypothetical protein